MSKIQLDLICSYALFSLSNTDWTVILPSGTVTKSSRSGVCICERVPPPMYAYMQKGTPEREHDKVTVLQKTNVYSIDLGDKQLRHCSRITHSAPAVTASGTFVQFLLSEFIWITCDWHMWAHFGQSTFCKWGILLSNCWVHLLVYHRKSGNSILVSVCD